MALSLFSTASAQEAATPDVAVPEIALLAADFDPPVFDTPEAALDAFKQALQAEGSDAVATLLGLDPVKLKADENTDVTLAAIKAGVAKQLILTGDGDRRIVVIGEKLWPLPFPVVKGDDGKWAFDTFDGLAEIVNRRVGENELQAIETMRAYVDAQEDYAVEDRDEDGVEEFAQKLVSSEGTTDGLYWPTDDVNGESPAGDLDQSELDDAAKGEGYFGYKYKILDRPGRQHRRRRLRLYHQRQHDRWLRAHRLAGQIRRDRGKDLRRKPARRRLRDRSWARHRRLRWKSVDRDHGHGQNPDHRHKRNHNGHVNLF